jgi:RND family efflux transporter MFP subunit
MMRFISATFTLTAMLVLAACDKEPPKVETPVRAIKTFTVTEVASGQTRKYSGIVQATDTSALSFQVNGNVQKVLVNRGDRVKKGQVLAVLDKQPYELDVKALTAELGRAKSIFDRQRDEFNRQKKMFAQGWISKARLDKYEQTYKSADSSVDYARSKLGIAKRDLRNTVLKAPFDGSIAKKTIDPFVEVKAGQKLFAIEASGTLEVRCDIPETTNSRVSLGMPVTVSFPTAPGKVLQARITEVGSAAGRANAFPVKAGLDDPPAQVRSGMTAEVRLLLKEEGTKSGYLVPLAAFAPADKPSQGYLFIFDPKTQTVKKQLAKARGSNDNFAHVYEGVKAGDIVAAAGVTFLNDGQKVKLMVQQAPNILGAPAAAK